MKSNEVAELAQKVGTNTQIIQLAVKLSQNPELLMEVEARLTPKDHRPEFPMRTSANPARRQEKMAQRFEDAPQKSYERRERSVRTSGNSIDRDIWLRNNYTNDDGQMICQICKKEMPFKKRDGEYYFEAVEIFTDLSIEHAELHLALCPVCAAKYKEFVKHDPDGEMQRVKSAIMEENEPEIGVHLAGKNETVRFVETHFEDLKTILQEESSATSASARSS